MLRLIALCCGRRIARLAVLPAKSCTPELTRVKVHWKAPLMLKVRVRIHGEIDNPSDSATAQVNTVRKMPLQILWKTPLRIRNDV